MINEQRLATGLKRLLLGMSGILAVIGGAMMIFSGFATHSFLLLALPVLEQKAVPLLPATIAFLLTLGVGIVAILISLGGITVLMGGIMFVLGRRRIGSLLIALGGGTGFLGLLLALGYYLFTTGLSNITTHLEYWFGLVLAILARWLAKKS